MKMLYEPMLDFLKTEGRRALLSISTKNVLMQAVVFTTGNTSILKDQKGKMIDITDIQSECEDAEISVEPIN